MKLWQKVFCISLVCVILVTGGTTLLVLLNNFRASVRQETDRRISEHSFVVSTITNNVLYERLQRNVLMLDRMKVANNILNLTAEPLIVDGKTLVLSENGNISSDSFEPLSACTDYTDALEASDSEILTYLLDDGNAHYLLTGSRNYIENEPYSIITVADISGIFDSHYSELRTAECGDRELRRRSERSGHHRDSGLPAAAAQTRQCHAPKNRQRQLYPQAARARRL